MLRMTEREEREKCVETQRQKKGDLIVSVYLQFCHVCHMSLPTPTRPSLRGQMQRAPAAVHVISRPSISEPNLLPQIRHPGILTLRSGLRVLFSVVSSTPGLARVPDQILAQAVEA